MARNGAHAVRVRVRSSSTGATSPASAANPRGSAKSAPHTAPRRRSRRASSTPPVVTAAKSTRPTAVVVGHHARHRVDDARGRGTRDPVRVAAAGLHQERRTPEHGPYGARAENRTAPAPCVAIGAPPGQREQPGPHEEHRHVRQQSRQHEHTEDRVRGVAGEHATRTRPGSPARPRAARARRTCARSRPCTTSKALTAMSAVASSPTRPRLRIHHANSPSAPIEQSAPGRRNHHAPTPRRARGRCRR